MPIDLPLFVDACHKALKKSKKGFDYLTGRGLSVQTIVEECIGFCPRDVAASFAEQVTEDDNNWPRGEMLIKRIANMVIFPIRDDCGKIIAFASKEPEEGVKGWWNTPFTKDFYLYGMDKARQESFVKNKLYVVEGYLDVLSVRQAGIKNVAGIMSTTLTFNQLGVIIRYCDEICICLDTDVPKNGKPGGGQAGTKKIISNYLGGTFINKMSIIRLPFKKDENGNLKGNDPDEFLKENNAENFLQLEKMIE